MSVDYIKVQAGQHGPGMGGIAARDHAFRLGAEKTVCGRVPHQHSIDKGFPFRVGGGFNCGRCDRIVKKELGNE